MNPKSRKMVSFLAWVLALAYPAGWILSEFRWSRVNDPTGKFENASEYLAQSRQPSRVTSFELKGKSYLIAYGPLDIWLAVPSSPAAYVFDEQGHMVEWSADPGDDKAFQDKWPISEANEVTVADLRRLGTE